MQDEYIEKIYDAGEPPQPNTVLPLIGICVSYCYYDTLQFMLPVNYVHFNKLYIITQEDDNQTIELCKQFKNVEILFYDFKNNNKRFDKFGAIKYAQEKVYKSYPNSWYLIIDSDIILPNNFINILINENLNADCIYGAYRLNIFKTSELFRKNLFIQRNERLHSNITNNIVYRKKYPPSILGCFQLYKKKCYQPENFQNAGWGDYQFGYDNFNLFCNLNNLIYIHLGEGNKNWNGKLVPFTNDSNVNLNNLYFNSLVNCKNIYFNQNCMIVDNSDLNYISSNEENLSSSQEFCRDILNFYYGKQSYKIIEFRPVDDYNTKFFSNIFSKIYVVEKTKEFTSINCENVQYINLDYSNKNWDILPSDIDIILLYITDSYKNDINYIKNSLSKFKQLKYVIFGYINKLSNNENLIIDELFNKNILIFERFIGINDIIDNKNVHEGIICSVNTNLNINENDSNSIINKINNINDTNMLIIKNKTYSWENGIITFLNYMQLETTFGEGSYYMIDLYTFQVKIRNKNHILVFNDDYTEFTSTRMEDKEIVKGKLIIFSENILEDKTYTWMNTSISFFKNGNMKAFGRGKYSKIDEFTFNVNFGGKEYIFIFNNRFTEFIAKRTVDKLIVKGKIVILDEKILEYRSFTWNNKSITFLENGEINAKFGKGTYRQIDLFTFNVIFIKREYDFVFNNDYSEFTATRINDNVIIKGKLILNSNILEDKTYSWCNSSITFLQNGQMNAFGRGQYKQIDIYTFQAKFGNKFHKFVFNRNYTEFIATRLKDKVIIKGNIINKNNNNKNNKNNNNNKGFSSHQNNNNVSTKILTSDSQSIKEKTYSWGNSSITFLKNGKMNAFGNGHYKQIDPYTLEANFGKKNHIIKFNSDYSEFVSTRMGDNVIVNGKQISNERFNPYRNNKSNLKNKVISNTQKIENKIYIWGDRKITFLKNGLMNAFGKGSYKQIDPYTFQAFFGNKKHILKFNNAYTEFTSTRIGDNVTLKSSIL